MKCLVFPSKYRIYRALLWVLLDMNNFGLENLLSSVKHLVQGQCSALESHIAVCKSYTEKYCSLLTFCKHFNSLWHVGRKKILQSGSDA